MDNNNKTIDELREYLINQIEDYNKMLKDLKKKQKETNALIKEARLLISKIKEGEANEG